MLVLGDQSLNSKEAGTVDFRLYLVRALTRVAKERKATENATCLCHFLIFKSVWLHFQVMLGILLKVYIQDVMKYLIISVVRHRCPMNYLLSSLGHWRWFHSHLITSQLVTESSSVAANHPYLSSPSLLTKPQFYLRQECVNKTLFPSLDAEEWTVR